ncbi:MAG: hypothetical protein JWO94_1615 [Verrucomicrobiaceae bacterium]|nr:hypothetical protein [Verrucomicrobiaceae bacterium]
MKLRLFCCLLACATALSAQEHPLKKKLEPYLLLPEPSALRTNLSQIPPGSHKTVLSPAFEIEGGLGIKVYSKEDFAKLGIGLDAFIARAKVAADARLKLLEPDFVKDENGKTRYAVYRGDSALIASLLVAPSLGKSFDKLFDGEMWAVAPDRHSLFLFPAKPEMLAEFADDLQERYKADAYAASCEVFLIKSGEVPKVIATFGD